MRKYLLTTCLLGGAFVTPVGGQVFPRPYENKWEFSFFVGGSHLGEESAATPVEDGSSQQVDLQSSGRTLLGVRITENLGQHFGAELEYSLADHPLEFRNLRAGLARLEVNHKVHKVAYSILVYPWERQKRLRPYGSVGAGASFFHVTGSSREEALQQGVDFDGRWKFAFSYGAGVKYQLGRNWGVRADFRDHVTDVPDFGLPSVAPAPPAASGAGFRPQGTFHNWQMSVSFMYTFNAR